MEADLSSRPIVGMPIARSATVSGAPHRHGGSKHLVSTSEDISDAVFSTPRKTTSDSLGDAILASSPMDMRKARVKQADLAQPKEITIYDALGWDDDFDDIGDSQSEDETGKTTNLFRKSASSQCRHAPHLCSIVHRSSSANIMNKILQRRPATWIS